MHPPPMPHNTYEFGMANERFYHVRAHTVPGAYDVYSQLIH